MLSCFCLTQFAAADELDATFGVDGRIATAVGNYEDNAYAVALQQDGKILVGGASSNGADYDFALVRYNRDGSLDPAFNFNGMTTTQVGRGDDEIAALAVQKDGYIVAAGYTVQDGNRDFALVRYAPDGQCDPSFGLDGIVITGYGTLDDEITAITLDDEGRIVIAGYSTGTAGRVVVVGRYLANGELDVSFGFDGISVTGIGDDALARSIDVDEKGRILVAGSYFHADHTEVMVLRFTDSGELDATFGVEGLALTGYFQDSTEGFGVKLHSSGAILVAGAVSSPGGLDAALFKFSDDGQPDTGFGNNGMMAIEASLEDDMALALDIKEDVVYLSGFTTVNGARQFLFISLLLPEIDSVAFTLKTGDATTNLNIGQRQDVDSSGRVVEIESVPFILKTGDATTSLNIGQRQDVASFEEFLREEDIGTATIQTTISQAAFGITSNDTSYAVAVQPDGMAVAAGVSEENGVMTFAVARFASSDVASASAANQVSLESPTNWIQTKNPFGVNRTGATSGGIISDAGVTITQRGVVFSIAPDPVLKDGGSGGNGGGGGTDTTPPVITAATATLTTGSTEATLSVTTDESATCGYSLFAGDPFDQMTLLSTTDGLDHTATVPGVVENEIIYVKCQDDSGNTTTTDREVTVGISTVRIMEGNPGMYALNSLAAQVGDFVVGTANAQTTTSTTSIFDSSTSFVEEGFTEDGSGTGSYSSIIKNLKPGTFYYVRAYALASDGTVYYGNQFGFKTADSCFIATAAFGSILNSSVKLLRAFRDQYLMTNVPGRMFVKFYYRYSPPVADVIAGSPVLRAIVRVLLLPLVGISWLFLNLGTTGMLTVSALFLGPYMVYRKAWHKKAE